MTEHEILVCAAPGCKELATGEVECKWFCEKHIGGASDGVLRGNEPDDPRNFIQRGQDITESARVELRNMFKGIERIFDKGSAHKKPARAREKKSVLPELRSIKELAEAAGGELWVDEGVIEGHGRAITDVTGGTLICTGFGPHEHGITNHALSPEHAAYISAVSPACMIELIENLDRHEPREYKESSRSTMYVAVGGDVRVPGVDFSNAYPVLCGIDLQRRLIAVRCAGTKYWSGIGSTQYAGPRIDILAYKHVSWNSKENAYEFSGVSRSIIDFSTVKKKAVKDAMDKLCDFMSPCDEERY